MPKFCAIDIGKGGGFAWFDEGLLGRELNTARMPATPVGIQELIAKVGADVYIVEQVRLRHSDAADKRMFNITKMLANLNTVETIVGLQGKKVLPIYPNTWQAPYKARKKGKSYQQRKQLFKQVATKLFPRHRATLWNADALLILHFVLVQYGGQTDWIREQSGKLDLKLFE